MSVEAERVLIQHLCIKESLETIIREGFPIECIPNESLREVFTYAVDQFFRSGRIKAPQLPMVEDFGDLLADLEIDLEEEPEGSVEWAMDALKGHYIWNQSQEFNRRLAAEMADVGTLERLEVLHEFSSELVGLSMNLENREFRVDLREGLPMRLENFEVRSKDREEIYGMRLGLKEIDNYTRGIHPGELAVLAAGPKVGKSFFAAHVALEEWKAGKKVAYFTMENSIEDTLDRMACLTAKIDYRGWQMGDLPPDQVRDVREHIEEIQGSDVPMYLEQPSPGQRTVAALVRRAQILGADSLIIDQLSYVETTEEKAPRYIQIREMTHTLRNMISSTRERMPCLLVHQISREGIKMADKVGHLEMFHLAEGSETERTADWVFGLYRNRAEVSGNNAKFQTLAARREANRHFELQWEIGRGLIKVLREITLDKE